jgi:hypothetical protein
MNKLATKSSGKISQRETLEAKQNYELKVCSNMSDDYSKPDLKEETLKDKVEDALFTSFFHLFVGDQSKVFTYISKFTLNHLF